MNRTTVLLGCTLTTALALVGAACGGTTDVYFPSGQTPIADPTTPDGALTPEGCAASSDRLCEILAAERGQNVDYLRCRGLAAYGNMQQFCVANAKCVGRPYYDCMNGARSAEQARGCADDADRRCNTVDPAPGPAASGGTEGWVRHASKGGFTILMPAKPGAPSDGMHGEYASNRAGSACGTGWTDGPRELNDADLDQQVESLELRNVQKKRVTVLGRFRGLEVVGDNEDGQHIHGRVFGVGRRLFILMIINEQDAVEASAFFESFQLSSGSP